jgi:hypothetical protein
MSVCVRACVRACSLALVVRHASCMLYAFFWVIPWHLNFICRHFRTLCLFHLHRHICPPMKIEQTECSETSAYKIQMPGNYPEESIQHSESGESWKSRSKSCIFSAPYFRLCPVWLYHIFPHYLINITIFRKKCIEHKMCIVIFFTTFV